MDVMPRLLPLVFLLALAGAVRADDAPDPAKLDAKEIARLKKEMALRAAIPKSVQRGVAWLWKQQQDDGSFIAPPLGAKKDRLYAETHRFGKTALAALALVHSGVGPEDKRLAKTLDYLRKNWRGLQKGNGAYKGATYSLSILAMLLHTLHTKHGVPPEGPAVRTNPCGLPARDLAIQRLIARWLLRTRVKDSLFSYPSPTFKLSPKMKRKMPKGTPDPRLRVDLSNTQYALLGLWACARCGVKVPPGALESLTDALLAAQAKGGPAVKRALDPSPGDDPGAHVYAGLTDRARGFAYAPPHVSPSAHIAMFTTGSMTTGGLSSLLIVKAILREQAQLDERTARRLDRGIWDAIAWLDKHYRVDANPTSMDVSGLPIEQAKLLGRNAPKMNPGWLGYYLYGLERSMVIAGKRFVGTHDWYIDGARHLLATQAAQGQWPKLPEKEKKTARRQGFAFAHWPLVDTCFAVLFLQRATLRPRAPLIETKRAADR